MFTLIQLLEEIIELSLIRINLKIGTHTHTYTPISVVDVEIKGTHRKYTCK